LRFDDVVTCVASMAVIFALIFAPLDMVLFSALGISGMTKWGYTVSSIISSFLSALISGYIHAGKIWEARREAITKITVLWAALFYVLVITVPASIADWGLSVKEDYLAKYPGTTLSTSEWVTWEMMFQDVFAFLLVGMALVLSLIGLYIGSMFRRPAKSGK